MYCKDCKFWERFGHDGTEKFSQCNLPNWVDYGSRVITNMTESDIAFYADASDDTGLHAGILTGALFGCIKFKKLKVKK